ncbi:AraC family transcriptional regulator [Vibrio porteresiae]|uniref:AraC family transcriptional regulator n=1 Tax=Vibrio porteresiae DSM 19223 TaxID=1123496 RepID=A0ABZ0QI82_9VIBR|nr:AraC family transcriptional regulator [Vibrio porteresiae]WPC76208.1 AraC family transcriptional regulator [Vibrio porteresiae DSM 19223]
MSTIDPLSDVFRLLAARSYVTLGQRAGDHWSISYNGFNGMKFLSLKKGDIWFRSLDQSAWHKLLPGDSLIITRFTPFILATNPNLIPTSINEIDYSVSDGIAHLGGDASMIISGKMEIDQVGSFGLLDCLPDVIFIAGDTNASSSLQWLMNKLHEETQSQALGSALIGDHMMQLIMIEGIRSWVLKQKSEVNGWIGALNDARIMKALNAIHNTPTRHWQLSDLADVAGMSRTGFARLFLKLTGTSAINYLTQLRMLIASRALRLSNESIKHLSFRLGYSSESSFSTTFKRVYGASPKAHRLENREGALANFASINSLEGARKVPSIFS